MQYDKELIAHKLDRWDRFITDYHLPEWDAIPDLGLYMDQVILLLRQYLGPLSRGEEDKPITASIINNYVRLKVMPPPVKKKYNRRQLSRIIIINMLKTALPMESICRILSYVNGQLDDESDDIIDDSVMYLIFLRLAAANRDTWPPRGLQETLDAVLSGYQEPCPGARHRVADALEVMLTAWFSSQLQKQAAEQMQQLGI